jgi:hypothetical protein
MIADPQQRDRTEPNALRYFCAPFTPYHPFKVLPGQTTWSSVVGRAQAGFYPDVAERALAVLRNSVNASVQANVARPQRVRVRREVGAGVEFALDGDNSVAFVAQLAPMGTHTLLCVGG